MERLLICVVVLLAMVTPAEGQTSQTTDLQARVRALEDQVRSLQAQLNALLAAVPPPVAPVSPPAQLPAPAEAQPKSNVFNPDIGMIGNLVGAGGSSKGGSDTLAPLPLVTLQESEASFQSIIDPFARADFFLAIGEEGIEVEEGFITFTTLPGRLLLKAGKMRANFGRLNAFHNHTLPWIDRPLVMFNLLGGEATDPDTGIKDAGLSVSRLIPAGKLFVEATGELYRGDSGTVFKSSRRADFSTVAHVRAYTDLTDDANIEVGGSYSRGHNELGSAFVTQLYGTDITFRWRPLQRAIYRSVAARAELIWSRREDLAMTQKAFGLYASLDYQLARRWVVGGRFDQSDRAQNALVQDRGFSGVLTFRPSEFSQIRSQYRRTRFGDGRRVANELLFQVLFTIGAHGAHVF